MQIVPPGLKYKDPFPQAACAGSLVRVRGCRDSQHLQRTVVHCFKMKIQPKLWHKDPGNLLFGGKSPVRHGEWCTGAEWEGKTLTPPIISLEAQGYSGTSVAQNNLSD